MPEQKQKRYWVGFDLGGTKMLAAVFDRDFRIMGRTRRKTQVRENSKAGVDRIIDTVQSALQEDGVKADQLAGIGVGIPGPVDPERGIVLHAPNLGWKDFQLKKPLESGLRCPVFIVNDVDAGVFGEHRFGAGREARCLVGVFPGTGIGAGCVYQGRIFMGKNRSCFEFGHTQVIPDGPLCGCGRLGCLEAVASRLAISSAAATAVYRGQAPNLQASVGTDLSNIRSAVLAAAIKAGDQVVEQIVRSAAGWLGVGVANLVNLLAPDVVVLGGGLVEAMPELFLKVVEQAVRRRVMPVFEGSYRIVVSELGDDAVAKGAAAWARENVAA
jgi:glucokinase